MLLTEIQHNNQFYTDKGSVHSYLEYYDTIFAPYKDKDINILEIGIDHGGSIELWHKYFTPNSNIYGMDVYLQPTIPKVELLPNVTILHKNAYKASENFLDPIRFDIIIDDGTHYVEDQKIAFNFYIHKLKPGGIFIIEDLQPAGYEHFKMVAETTPNCELVDRRSVKNRYDDLLFVYRKV